MKYRFFALMMATLIGFASCTRSNDAPNTNTNTTVQTPTGNWKVTLYMDNSNGNITSRFNGYSFIFDQGGLFMGQVGNTMTHGTWLLERSNDNGGSWKLRLDFNSNDNQLKKVGKNWQVTEMTSNSIKVKDDNTASAEKMDMVRI
jgi:major membrane immunogen (membrane-anchored lipoprotein)